MRRCPAPAPSRLPARHCTERGFPRRRDGPLPAPSSFYRRLHTRPGSRPLLWLNDWLGRLTRRSIILAFIPTVGSAQLVADTPPALSPTKWCVSAVHRMAVRRGHAGERILLARGPHGPSLRQARFEERVVFTGQYLSALFTLARCDPVPARERRGCTWRRSRGFGGRTRGDWQPPQGG